MKRRKFIATLSGVAALLAVGPSVFGENSETEVDRIARTPIESIETDADLPIHTILLMSNKDQYIITQASKLDNGQYLYKLRSVDGQGSGVRPRGDIRFVAFGIEPIKGVIRADKYQPYWFLGGLDGKIVR